jgi:trehalose 6-phosphate synthase/phosphatase
LVQKCLIPSSRLLDETNTLKEIRHLVKRIQDKFGPHVIDCEEIIGSSVPIDQRIALWNVADVLMITPIREGLNLLPLEYVYVRKEPTPPGVVISSEFSAVCSVLNGALRCNPFDIQVRIPNSSLYSFL